MKNLAKTPKVTLIRFLPWLYVIAGSIALICAFIIMFEKLELLQNPHYTPSCNLNPIISCGSVMASSQSHAFGFPNPLIGLMAFPVVIATGMALLAGAQAFRRWYWVGLELGSLFGVAFVHWLMFESVYRIGALCPYCMVVWVMTIAIFWYTTLYTIQLNFHLIPEKWESAAVFVRKHHLDIFVFWLVVIAAFILKHFWYYYGHLL
jgi:uncharacterized membrane protein